MSKDGYVKVSLDELPISIGPKTTAEILNVSVRHVHRMAEKGLLPGFRVGSLWRFNAEQIKKIAGVD